MPRPLRKFARLLAGLLLLALPAQAAAPMPAPPAPAPVAIDQVVPGLGADAAKLRFDLTQRHSAGEATMRARRAAADRVEAQAAA
ncbi:MAG: hypothetical protein KGI51_14140, partial [Rhodospirillales bacterium]|nr:hypothetical protein [Rhodospirillales bacterium]